MDHGGLGRRFWTLWSAFGASNLGDGFTLVGYPLLAVSLTDDARLVTAVAAFRFLPFLVVGLPAGVLIDRFDRRKLAIVAQICRSAGLLLVAAAVVGEYATIPLLCGTAFAVGTGEVLIDGGLPAIVRDVVESSALETANSRLRAAETVANAFIGPPIGAAIFVWHPSAPFAVAAAVFGLSIVLLALLGGSYLPDEDPHEDGFVDQIRRGLSYVWNHSILRPLALSVAAFSFAGQASNATLVILVTERLGLSEVQYGLLLAIQSVVAFVVAFMVPWIVKRTSHGWSMRISVIAFSAFGLILGTTGFIPLVVIALMIAGVGDPTWNVVSSTVRQRLVDDHIFGRMMTAYLFIAWSLNPVGAMVAGVMAEAFGPQWVYVMAAAVVGSLLIAARGLFPRVDAAMAEAQR